MSLRKLLLGLAAGAGASYLAVLTVEAVRQWREPSPPLRRDATGYARIRRSIEVVESGRTVTAMVALVYGGPGDALDRAVRPAPVWLRPALYFGALSLLWSLGDLPGALVFGYALERRFGLSDQPRKAWLADFAKTTVLGVATSSLLASLFGIAVRRAPNAWPLVAAAGTFPLLVLANLIVPLYVLPLFNAFEPVTGPLEDRLRALAARFNVGDADILRMNMSRQTRKANAFVTGIGTTHRIVLGDTLIDGFDAREIEFVVAHELGHYVSRDTWRTIAAGGLLASLLFVTSNALTRASRRRALRDSPQLIARLYATMLLALQALRPVLLAFSRSREWSADRFALAATHDAAAGVAALRRLRDRNLADDDPPLWYEIFFSSHPSLKRRIAALQA